ncbi:hypothetical protein JCGZ_13496 [Jatropha curcas]|uniref:Uncharacterized protein n=1 Tax=Jatropha curcas TaxID=180498 RepID=A0A067LMK7_JATCU|nr:hypothetical protein JCGZ_13496 [Jatropha curcas]
MRFAGKPIGTVGFVIGSEPEPEPEPNGSEPEPEPDHFGSVSVPAFLEPEPPVPEPWPCLGCTRFCPHLMEVVAAIEVAYNYNWAEFVLYWLVKSVKRFKDALLVTRGDEFGGLELGTSMDELFQHFGVAKDYCIALTRQRKDKLKAIIYDKRGTSVNAPRMPQGFAINPVSIVELILCDMPSGPDLDKNLTTDVPSSNKYKEKRIEN